MEREVRIDKFIRNLSAEDFDYLIAEAERERIRRDRNLAILFQIYTLAAEGIVRVTGYGIAFDGVPCFVVNGESDIPSWPVPYDTEIAIFSPENVRCVFGADDVKEVQPARGGCDVILHRMED